MTYLECTPIKNNEIHNAETLNQCESQVGYRVPKGSENAVLVLMNPSSATFTIKSADHVFGGKDQEFYCPTGFHAIFVDLNTFNQNSGENEGCVVVETTGDEFQSKLFVYDK